MKKALIILFVSYTTSFSQIYPSEIEEFGVDTTFIITINEKVSPRNVTINIDSISNSYMKDAFKASYSIKIYDSITNNLIQEIIDTLDYDHYRAGVKLFDINCDDYMDFAVINDITMQGDPIYNFWLYDPKIDLFYYNSEYSDLCCDMIIYPSQKQIEIDYYNLVTHFSQVRIYKLFPDKPVLIEMRETSSFTNAGADSILIQNFKLINGELQKVEEYKEKDE